MQFIYHELASIKILKIDGELSKYIFKVRRYDSAMPIYFRNLKDDNIYKYKVENITRRDATLSLIDFEIKIIKPDVYLHIGWCIIDPKSIEKQIASLNEIGVSKITFIYCGYSQKKYKPNFEKLNKLLVNSSQQCGRSDIIKLDSCDSLESFLIDYPKSYMFNFTNNQIAEYKNDIETIILGCEGGFTKEEVEDFDQDKIVGVNSNLIMRSETASISLSSLILL